MIPNTLTLIPLETQTLQILLPAAIPNPNLFPLGSQALINFLPTILTPTMTLSLTLSLTQTQILTLTPRGSQTLRNLFPIALPSTNPSPSPFPLILLGTKALRNLLPAALPSSIGFLAYELGKKL
jgi:hypothetical protein